MLRRITSPPHGRGLSRLLLALLVVLAAGGVGACDDTSPSGPPAPLDLEGEGKRAADAALAAAARDRHVNVRRARRLGVAQCRPEGTPDGDDVYCYVEFTAYPGSLRRFCTRTYQTTLSGEAATAAEGWEITCQRYGSRKSARAAREGKVSPEEARREARQRARREARAQQR